MKDNSLYRKLNIFFGDISLMIESGQPMADILFALSSDASGSWKKTLAAVARSLDSGCSLGTALENCGGFPEYAVRMVKSGEQAGRLEETSGSLALYYENRERMRSLVDTALIQPVILLSLLAVVLACFTAIILPVIENVYESLGGGGGLYMAAGYVIGILAFVLLLAALITMLVIKRRISERGTEGFGLLSRLGPVEELVRKTDLAFFMADFATRVSGGIPSDYAFKDAAECCGNEKLRSVLSKCAEKLEDGESLSMVCAESGIFPNIINHMMSSGSRNGSLDEALEKASDMLLSESATDTENLIKRIEPILTGFFTVSVGAALISVMLPLIGIITAIG